MQLRVGRPQLQRLCLALSLAFLFAIIAVAVFSENLAGYAGLSEEYHSLTDTLPVFKGRARNHLPEELRALWHGSIHKLSSPSFTTEDGATFEIAPDVHRRGTLGKKILLIDVDSRLDLSEGAILNTQEPKKGSMKGRTAGILNHFLYALVHGYDYRLIRAPQYNDRHGTWVKVPVMRKALETHDTVIFLDSDAIFEHIGLPFEWLMGRWNITEETLLAIAEDPKSDRNSDTRGKVMWNTGFMVGQRTPLTDEFFGRWEDCPKGERYEGCRSWSYDWAHEQAALANFVRYDYADKDNVRVIKCNEGNGMPGPRGGPNCNGVFVRHYWFGKDSTVKELYDLNSEEMIVALHRHFHKRREEFFLDLSSLTYPLNTSVVI